MLTQARITARAPERHLQELLNAWVQKYFTGQPHIAKLGDVTFPLVDLFFNQSQIGSPNERPQFHFAFTDFRPHESWFANGNLSPWNRTLANPASGVSYGSTQEETVEESVHGKLARTLPGTDYRVVVDGDGWHEQTFVNHAWLEQRVIPNATAVQWTRAGGNYVEQAIIDGAPVTQRTIITHDPVWDGTKKLVCVDTTITLFVRTVNSGETGQAPDFLCRSVSDNFRELLTDEITRAELTQKGFRRMKIVRGPSPMASTGFQTRMILLAAELRYFLPREQ